MIRILLTGGAGYIGSHTAKRLSQAGFEPVTLDNLSSGHKWAVKWGPLVEGDIGDQKLIREVVAKYQIQAVLHFAAYINVVGGRPPANIFTTTLSRLSTCSTRFWIVP